MIFARKLVVFARYLHYLCKKYTILQDTDKQQIINYDNEIFIAKISMANSIIYNLGIDCPYTRVWVL